MPDTRASLFFYQQLCSFIMTLHDRGALNEQALEAVLKDLLDYKPLTLEALASVFGVDAIDQAVQRESRLRPVLDFYQKGSSHARTT